jgi:hypothetical protein
VPSGRKNVLEVVTVSWRPYHFTRNFKQSGLLMAEGSRVARFAFGTIYQNGENMIYDRKISYKINQIKTKYSTMAIQNIKILHSKYFQNLPKLGFWYENMPSGNPGRLLKEF